jgi:hypothetical protein
LLQPAINVGLLEHDFWDMTKAEVERYLEGAVWRMKQKAQFDYSLAELIGVSVARIMDSGCKFPELYEVYPHLFESEIKEQEEIQTTTTNSINNFMAFAMKHNAKMKGVETENYDN